MILLLLTLLLVSVQCLQAQVIYNTSVVSMMNAVTQADITSDMNKLTGITPVIIGGVSRTLGVRVTGTTNSTYSTQWAYERGVAVGLSCAYESWGPTGGYSDRNVVCTKTGTKYPSQIVIISGHIDTVAGTVGAEDNASGAEATMKIMEVMAAGTYQRTIRFIIWTGEEQGLYGSQAYLAAHPADDYRVMVSLEFMGVDSDGSMTLITRVSGVDYTKDHALVQVGIDASTVYALTAPVIERNNGQNNSDHATWWNAGFAASLGVSWVDTYPCYHDPCDTVAQLNMAKLTAVTKSMVATAAHWAGLVWAPPLGIPVPAWPAELNMLRPTFPNPWTTDQAGWYYIQASGCSDVGRTYGNPSAPRCSLPTAPAVGSKIVLNGTISGNHCTGCGEGSSWAWTGNSSNPIWVMPYDSNSPPVIAGVWEYTGSYVITDGLYFNYADSNGNLWLNGGNHHMVRLCHFTNTINTASGTSLMINVDDAVVYNNLSDQQGDWQSAGANDRIAIKVFGGSRIWIVDNVSYHAKSDGMAVGDQFNTAAQVNHVYVGRNEVYENQQYGIWVKNASYVVISQNYGHDLHFTSDNGAGGCFGGQYDPQNVWFIFNKCTNANNGVRIEDINSGGGGPWYIVGNWFAGIEELGNCNNYQVGAIGFRNTGTIGYAAYNTIYDSSPAIAVAGGTLNLRDNILANLRTSCSAMIVSPGTLNHDYNLFTSSTYDIGTEAHRTVGNPLFVNAPALDFHLNTGTAALNKAFGLEAAYTDFENQFPGMSIRYDYDGLVRPQGAGWEQGAYEYALTESVAYRLTGRWRLQSSTDPK